MTDSAAPDGPVATVRDPDELRHEIVGLLASPLGSRVAASDLLAEFVTALDIEKENEVRCARCGAIDNDCDHRINGLGQGPW